MRGRLLGVVGSPAWASRLTTGQAQRLVTAGACLTVHGGQAAVSPADGLYLVADPTAPLDLDALLESYRAAPERWTPPLAEPCALALYDAPRARLLLVRGPVGTRPLHVARLAGGLGFATWPTQLLRAGLVSPRVRLTALLDSVVAGGPIPPETLYEGIDQVLPGTVAAHDLKSGRGTTWPLAEPTDHAATRLGEVLRDRLAALGPAAVLLSGGLDSGWLAALAPRPALGVTVGFGPTVPQVDLAGPLARWLGLPHRAIEVGPRLAQGWWKLVQETGLPLGDLGPAALAAAVGEAQQAGAAVVVSGLGADELGGGAPPADLPGPWVRRRLGSTALTPAAARRLYGVLPACQRRWDLLLRLRRSLLAPELVAAHRLPAIAPPRRPAPAEDLPEASARWRFAVATHVLNSRLPALESAAAAVGVEVVTPYLEPAVVQAALADGSKAWVRSLARRDLPDDVVHRRRRPRYRPNVEWLLADPLPEPVGEALAPRTISRLGWFDPVTVHLWLREVRLRPRSPLNRLRARLLLTVAATHALALDLGC